MVIDSLSGNNKKRITSYLKNKIQLSVMESTASQILEGIKENGFRVFKDKRLAHGMKYKIQPPIIFTDLKGEGCPNDRLGWLRPDDQTTFKLLRNYFATQLGIEKSDDSVTVTLLNTKFDHDKQGCYEECVKFTEDPALCLRTWIITDLHMKNGKKSKRIKTDPWCKMTPRIMNLKNVSGHITSVFVPDTAQNKVKLWCSVDEGVASPKDKLPVTDNFSVDDFLALSDSE